MEMGVGLNLALTCQQRRPFQRLGMKESMTSKQASRDVEEHHPDRAIACMSNMESLTAVHL